MIYLYHELFTIIILFISVSLSIRTASGTISYCVNLIGLDGFSSSAFSNAAIASSLLVYVIPILFKANTSY